MEDFDSFVEFWITGMPYIWVNNSDVKKCKRFYLSFSDIAIFDKNNNVASSEYIKSKDIPKKETFCILPINKNENCKIVRNYFLCDVKLSPNNINNDNIRIDGKNINLSEYANEYTQILHNYHTFWIKYPMFKKGIYDIRFSYPLEYLKITNPNTSLAPIVFTAFGEKAKFFTNIFKVQQLGELSNMEIQNIHYGALLNIYKALHEGTNYRQIVQNKNEMPILNNDLALIHYLLKDTKYDMEHLSVKYKGKGDWLQWEYKIQDYEIKKTNKLNVPLIILAHFNYKIAVGKQKFYSKIL